MCLYHTSNRTQKLVEPHANPDHGSPLQEVAAMPQLLWIEIAKLHPILHEGGQHRFRWKPGKHADSMQMDIRSHAWVDAQQSHGETTFAHIHLSVHTYPWEDMCTAELRKSFFGMWAGSRCPLSTRVDCSTVWHMSPAISGPCQRHPGRSVAVLSGSFGKPSVTLAVSICACCLELCRFGRSSR